MLSILIGLGLMGSAFVGFSQLDDASEPTDGGNVAPVPEEGEPILGPGPIVEPEVAVCPIDETESIEKPDQEEIATDGIEAELTEKLENGITTVEFNIEENTAPNSGVTEIGELKFGRTPDGAVYVISAPVGWQECGNFEEWAIVNVEEIEIIEINPEYVPNEEWGKCGTCEELGAYKDNWHVSSFWDDGKK